MFRVALPESPTLPMPIFPNVISFLCAACMLFLSSCGTPEYRDEHTHCEAEWLLKIPPVYQQELVTKYRTKERLTGETVCTTEGATTTCERVKERISVPYQTVEKVDIKKPQRTPQIQSCTKRACLAKYGNSKCEA